jgi:hypothetical protein
MEACCDAQVSLSMLADMHIAYIMEQGQQAAPPPLKLGGGEFRLPPSTRGVVRVSYPPP